ncbi:MAG: hypothetical protein ACREWE_08525 [Gammaproteobacteria bacterium]
MTLDIIREAAADGVSLALSPAGTIRAAGDQAAMNRWLPVLREHKPGILAALRQHNNGEPKANHATLPPLSPAAESRRQRVLALLARNGGQYAVLIEDPNTDPVVMALATPDGTCELLVPRDRCDAFAILAMVDGWNRADDYEVKTT